MVRPEPTRVPDPTLITDVQEYIERYVSLLPAQSLVEAVWALHTYLIRIFPVTPYLYISSKGPGTGKTRNMDVLWTLVRNPDSGTDSPVHVLGQEIAASQPTLFFDEVDTVFGGRANNPLKRFLNIGYMADAVIKRQRANEVEVWPVFCAKGLAGISNNHLPASLLSRSIPIEMQKRKGTLERFTKTRVLRDPKRIALVQRMAAFAEEFGNDMRFQYPNPLKALDDRQNEIVEPLLQIARTFDVGTENPPGPMEKALRDALESLFGEQRVGSAEVSRERDLLTRIRNAYDDQEAAGGDGEFIFTDDLAAALPTINAVDLAINLEEIGFVRGTKRQQRKGEKVLKGYAREDFEPLFAYWLDETTEQKPERALELVDDEEDVA